MKIDSKLFRLTICAALLGASTLACSAPTQPNPTSSASPVTSPNASQPVIQSSPVALNVSEVKPGDGTPLDGAAAFHAKIRIWSDKFEGKPFGRGSLELMLVPESGQMPGLIEASKNMKVGGITNIEISALELFGEIPAGATMDPNTKLFIELSPTEVFAKEEFKIETVKEGKGDKVASDGDPLAMHYVGRLDNFDDGKVFDSSREKGRPFNFVLGKGQVIAGWDQGVKGMKKGEVRRLSIPHYLAYGTQDKGSIPPKSRLFFEIELLDIVAKGELKSEIVTPGDGDPITSGQKGDFHYTGWLVGFESDQKFDSSLDRGQPFPVTLGQGQVIKGWDEGLVGMKPGEVRRLTIPFNLAYGPNGSPPKIPAYATLYFEVTYVGLSK